MNRKMLVLEWVLFLFWVLFVNALNEWLLGPLVEDYAAFGVVGIFVIAVLWITSIPRQWKKRWVSFTLYGLLMGEGLSSVAFYPMSTRIPLSILLCLGLIVVTFFYARIRFTTLVVSALGLLIANGLLPISEWPFLTHFSVANYSRITLDPSDLSALPLSVIQTNSGQAVVTLQNVKDSKTTFEKQAVGETSSTDSLENYLRNYKHRYSLVEISKQGSQFHIGTPAPSDLAGVNPDNLTNMFFPFNQAFWNVENGQVIQFMTPSQLPRRWIEMALDAADYPANLTGLAMDTERAQQQNWQDALTNLGVKPVQPTLQILNGRLLGSYQGTHMDVAVRSTSIVGYGAFTAPNTHQVLLQGVNVLEVVSLDTRPGRVVAAYSGTVGHALVNDIIIGAIDNSGQNVIFVNSSPAYILKRNSDGTWSVPYTATNPSFRFEGSVKYTQDSAPEIITDDPSYVRNAPTRYFSSYTFSHGNLERNWRVYRTNVVNVRTVQFDKNGPTYLVAAIFATGKYLILKRHFIPVVPIASGLLALSVIIGWIVSFRKRGVKQDA